MVSSLGGIDGMDQLGFPLLSIIVFLPLAGGLKEVALSSVGILGVRVPIGGGSAFRLLPWGFSLGA